MKEPGIPDDEWRRLETLQSLNILDTPSEDRYDCVTRLARQLFSVPISLVTMVDANRQWFKSCAGLSTRETPRRVSFCGHAILGDEVFVIPDTRADERFMDNPLVVDEPYIRFYAGCPYRAPDGSNLGTLCIIDRKPRQLTQEDIQALRDLTSFVEREIAFLEIATVDELTQVSNRRGFMKMADHTLSFCRRHSVPASLVFLDLDGFKTINDTLGHAEGDRVLAVFAGKLRQVCRESDILARLGGDEFAVLLTNTGTDRAEEFVARVQEALDESIREVDADYSIVFSHGTIEFDPHRHNTVEDMLMEGDRLMYECKRSKE
ncbi:diguanylate cyclase domain-containing protein [Vreelandella utahensis]|uniref:diguanylate cyclase domain-containing protein n=1 Tax=Vreelandella halophila TaxID=86177 RepID=UPI000986ACC3|nr:sensor domain-containing diguanylate cyclase [Halomonas utahensis]